jgi:dolichol-phosphate mannosyltransferase
MIDVDCEDPPEMIHDFLEFHEQGFDIVYGERTDRVEGLLMKSLRKLFYRSVRLVADDYFVLDMAEFSLITAEVREAILADATSYPFLRASIGRIGFRRKGLPYRRHARIAGETHYNLFGMTIFAVAGMLSASTLALRVAAYAFPFWLTVMIGIAVHASLKQAAWDLPVLLTLGFAFIAFSVIATGLYVARIYKDGLQRPNAIIRPHLSILPFPTNAIPRVQK